MKLLLLEKFKSNYKLHYIIKQVRNKPPKIDR